MNDTFERQADAADGNVGWVRAVVGEHVWGWFGQTAQKAPSSLEKVFADAMDEFAPASAQLRIFVIGRPTPLNPAVQEQLYLIGREALVNALRHSGATLIEAEIEYFPSRLRIVVRDNGSGMDGEMLDSAQNSHWGLVSMHGCAKSIGAKLQIWSSKGAGTEVEISIPNNLAISALINRNN